MTRLTRQQKRAQLIRRITQAIDEALAYNSGGGGDEQGLSVPDGYMPRKYACAVLGVSKTRLDQLADKGRICTAQRGWRVYYSVTDIVSELLRRHSGEQPGGGTGK